MYDHIFLYDVLRGEFYETGVRGMDESMDHGRIEERLETGTSVL